jgi:hypothetical protein
VSGHVWLVAFLLGANGGLLLGGRVEMQAAAFLPRRE